MSNEKLIEKLKKYIQEKTLSLQKKAFLMGATVALIASGCGKEETVDIAPPVIEHDLIMDHSYEQPEADMDTNKEAKPLDQIVVRANMNVSYSSTALTNEDVLVTITSDYPMKKQVGWTLSEDKLSLTKTYAKNTNETIVPFFEAKEGKVIEASNIVVSVRNIDKTAPNIQVGYSNSKPTNQNVDVILNADEPIQEVEGWTLSKDQTSLSRTFTSGYHGPVTIQDLAGNTTTKNIQVNIDKSAIIANVSYQLLEDNTVQVTIAVNKRCIISAIDRYNTLDGGMTYSAIYSANMSESIILADEYGNKITVAIDVNQIQMTQQNQNSENVVQPDNENANNSNNGNHGGNDGNHGGNDGNHGGSDDGNHGGSDDGGKEDPDDKKEPENNSQDNVKDEDGQDASKDNEVDVGWSSNDSNNDSNDKKEESNDDKKQPENSSHDSVKDEDGQKASSENKVEVNWASSSSEDSKQDSASETNIEVSSISDLYEMRAALVYVQGKYQLNSIATSPIATPQEIPNNAISHFATQMARVYTTSPYMQPASYGIDVEVEETTYRI